MTDSAKYHYVPTAFEYSGTDHTTQVSLVGSWDEWAVKTPMRKHPHSNLWVARLNLNPGPVTFKFVTDGKWVTSSTYDVVHDGYGGENNTRLISFADNQTLANKHDGEYDGSSEQMSAENTNREEESKLTQGVQEKENGDEGSTCVVC